MKKFKEQGNSSKNNDNQRVYIVQASNVWIRIMCKFWIISRSSSKFAVNLLHP